MVDAGGGITVHLIVGQCPFCAGDRLGTPDDPPVPGSPALCGACGGLAIIKAELLDDEWVPVLRRPSHEEREQLLARADVRELRGAFTLDDIERCMAKASTKPKMPTPPRTASKVRLGQNRLEAKGPDA